MAGSQFTQMTRPVEIVVMVENEEQHELEPRTVKLSYYRARITKNFFAEVDAITKIEDDDVAKPQLDALLLRLVKWWNVPDDDGAIIPLTPEGVAPLDPFFIGDLIGGIIKDHRGYTPGEAPGGKQNVTPLNGSSRQMVKKTASRRA